MGLLDSDSNSDSEYDDEVGLIHVPSTSSQPRCAQVGIQGVQACGIVDTGADITIIGRDLFTTIATANKLKKRDLKKPDKVPKTYDRQMFKVDSRLYLEVSFEGKTITTSVYVKLDAYDQLLLSERVCHNLGIVNYHLAVVPYARTKERKRAVTPKTSNCVTDPEAVELQTVRVQLVQAVTVLPYQAVLVPVVCDQEMQSTAVFEPKSLSDEGVIVEPALIQPNEPVYVRVANATGYTQDLSKNLEMGLATEASVVADSTPIINVVTSEPPEMAIEATYKPNGDTFPRQTHVIGTAAEKPD